MRNIACPIVLAIALPLAAQDAAHWTTVNGHRLYYERFGSGRPLVMLHGGGNSIHGSFAKQLEEFAKTHEIIAPEQVGQGHTPDVAGPLTYGGMADDTAALLEQLKVRDADVVGWSDGGNIALILAVRHPDLVRRIVVSGANFAPSGLPGKDLAEMRAQQQGLLRSKPHDAKLAQMWMTGPTTKELSPALLARIQKPVIVMAGDHDAILLDHTLVLYHALPQGRLCILPGTGHGTFIQRPEWVNPIVLSFFSE
jgi:pimeloyl-ACP methyl ester carboxylesterase